MNYFQLTLLLALGSFSCATEICLGDKQNCINELVDWCTQQVYTTVVYSVWTLTETIGYEEKNIRCTTDSTGTTCTINEDDWFTCTYEHIAIYKGIELSKDSQDGGDDEICYAASRIITSTWSVKNDEQCCINDLVAWCEEQDYSKVVCPSLWTYYTVFNGQHFDAECNTDSSGTVCTLNGSFLFSCSADHIVTYKDAVLCSNSIYGADCEICYVSAATVSINLPVPTCC